MRGLMLIDMRLQGLSDRQLRTAFLLARKDYLRFVDEISLPGAATAMAKLDMVLDEHNRRHA